MKLQDVFTVFTVLMGCLFAYMTYIMVVDVPATNELAKEACEDINTTLVNMHDYCFATCLDEKTHETKELKIKGIKC